MKNDHRSNFSNLSNWKEEAWKKNQGFIGIRTRDLRDTGAMLYQLSYEANLLSEAWMNEAWMNEALMFFFSGFFFPVA